MDNERPNLKTEGETALLVSVSLPKSRVDAKESLAELQSLAEAAGARVVGYATQKRRSVHPALYVGKGKAEQIAERGKQYGANIH